ncbi:diaminopimelate decarboxylase [Millionella massiliensis]|uniref:diaminopimelate decarboxylase n=1 Tax=Millionella massiliensis TaxID=1871023 RepID=UPI0008D94BFC|nr:diaminopimelate decarboxylase [Millionella massiliensis]
MSKYTLTPGQTVPPTPFYYYDLDLLRQTLETAQREAARYGYHIHYAMKANVEPRILHEIQQAGLGADCVSGYEVRCAVENGFSPDKIVFAGVGKSDHEIEYAIQAGIFAFNCESLQELEVINELAAAQGKTVSIALRINPNVQPDTHKYISTGQSESKFGISYTEIDTALAKLHQLDHIRIVGLHFHIGSQIRKMESFAELAGRVNEIAAWFASKGVELKHLNMGGGLGIDYQDPDAEPIPDFAGYFRTFHEHLNVAEGQTVHFELGRSIVAQCGELITRVLYTKTTAGGANFAITDAGMTELIRPALYSAHHKIENLTAAVAAPGSRPMGTYSIAGPICESSDIFARDIDFPASQRGDVLTLRSTGAYGSIMASNYNMRPIAPSHFSDEQ